MNDTKQRNGFVTAWLWIVMAVNLFTAILNIAMLFGKSSVAEVIWNGVGVIVLMIAALSAALLLKWNKLGFTLFVTSTFIYSLIGQLYIWESILITLINFVPLVFLWIVLQIKKDRKSAWSLLKGGADYRHCRHIYQLFGGLIALSVVCTLIATLTIDKTNIDPKEPVNPVVDEMPIDSTEVDKDLKKHKDAEPVTGNDGKRKTKDKEKHDETPILLYDSMSVDQLWEVLNDNSKDAEALYHLAKYYHKRDAGSDSKVVKFWKMTLLPEGDVQRCLPSGKRELTSVRFVFVMLARSYANMPENADTALREDVVKMLDSIQNSYSGYRYK